MKRLNEIAAAGLNGIVANYHGETREWWSDVNEEAIYGELEDPEFISFLDKVVGDSVSDGFGKAV